MPWSSLPSTVTSWVEAELDGRVIATKAQLNGFSSGSADRIVTDNGRRAFVKTVARSRNAETLELHRREANVMRMLPSEVRAPALLGVYDDDEWIALMLDDIEGAHPHGPHGSDIPAVLDAIADLPEATGPLAALPQLHEELADDFNAWNRIDADDVDEALPPLALTLRDRMMETAVGAADAVVGDRLVHLDCRADNILIDEAGAAWLIDWPWASIGARWFDGVIYLLDCVMRDEVVDADVYLGHPLFDGLRSEQVDAVLAALAGNFYNNARQPAPPNMPTLRAFQRAEADAAVTWLARRWASHG
ncbi:phosphotransferase family enzyme [Microbacterium sp. SLBN-154]|uniref:phosphotransferase n=1 Tax=Microbacterium sp. SLBN-154 TaxID=2768458 RepID=UPI00116BDA07|nr:phosphotransferase [Microbacterium sp. SLBN-154]TQK20160.1 phosphotransferase family enzyme [Microbacterium sp. SLBN-154]